MARREIQVILTDQIKKISLGAIGFTSAYEVLQNISRFIKQFPVFHVSLKEGNTIQLLDLLKKDICDFVFVQNYDQIDKDFIKMPIAKDSLIIAMSKDHPLAKEKKLTPDMLKNESFIACKPASVLQNIFEQICRKYDFKPQIDFLIDRSETILDLVSHSSRITYAMKKPTLQYRKENLVIREMNPPVETSIVMAYKKDKPLNDAGKAFLSFIKNVFPEA
ncbi:MAG: LysR family transcriptional regulator substrate-binding protein [Clostridiales bacterium]|nr:LysR family transcriptional regulator substrate-binding protein [Clostridiales bacterium]